MKKLLPVALLSTLVLVSCSVNPSVNPTTEPTMVVDGNSQFTPEGVNDMKSNRQASFDVSERPLSMAALGFDEDSDGILIATDPNKKIEVSIETPLGVVKMATDTMRVRPGGPVGLVDHIDIFYHFPNATDATPEISRAANELGFRFLDNFMGFEPDFKDGSGKETWVPGLGNSTGTVFSVEAILNHTTGSLLWIYSIQLADRYYTPAATAEIAATGDFTRS